MRIERVNLESAIGRKLSVTLRKVDGHIVLPAGRTLTSADVVMAIAAGHAHLPTIELDDGESGEEYACQFAADLVCLGPTDKTARPAGRMIITARRAGCLAINALALLDVNGSNAISVATLAHLSYIPAGGRVAVIQATPFVVDSAKLRELSACARQNGAALELLPIDRPRVGVVYADATDGSSARRQYEALMLKRLARYGVVPGESMGAHESMIKHALRAMLNARAELVIIASTAAPQWVGGMIANQVEDAIGSPPQFHLAPVDPCKAIMLAYSHGAAVVCVPGAYRQGNPTSFDLLLPALLARRQVSGEDIARLGEGGLLAA